MAVDLINVKLGDWILDVGCGVSGPMWAIAAHSCAKVVGITINNYQVNRARIQYKKAELNSLCEVVCGNFLEMPFSDNSFDDTYSIEATCHTLKLEEVYTEIFKVFKSGSMYVSSGRSLCCVCCASLFSVRARERKRDSKRERERSVWRPRKWRKMKTLKHWNEGFSFLFFSFFNFFYGKGWVEFGYIVFELNRSHWVFS